MSQAQQTAPPPELGAAAASATAPMRELSLKETLRVMDVAREMRDRRETAEEMFRRDDLRANLREKLLRQARTAGENVTEAEIDAAIGLYLERLHTYRDPPAGMKSVLAHAWVHRAKLILVAAATAVAAGGWLYFF